MLNPVVGLAALIALLWTLKLQREELKTSIDELRKTAEAANKQAETAEHQAKIMIRSAATADEQAEIMIRSARVQGLSAAHQASSRLQGSMKTMEGKELQAELKELQRLLDLREDRQADVRG